MEYAIYPLPHEIDYKEKRINLPEEISIDSTVDLNSIIVDRLNTALKMHDSKIVDKADYVIKIRVDKDLSEKISAYEIDIAKAGINIVTVDEKTVFYALSSLSLIFEQSFGELEVMTIKDYSDYKLRGIVEGYYGLPWGNKKRKDVIDFGSQFKMNAFVFAPKDDPFHRERWFDLYSSEDAKAIGDVAKFSMARNVTYYWTISPFLKNEHELTKDNIDEGLDLIIKKFEQLYEYGVRGFGVLGDDVGNLDYETVTHLVNELNAWCHAKGDVASLIFCPGAYNMEDWAFKDGSELNYFDKHFDEDVELFYTGESVCAPLDEEGVEAFKTRETEEGQVRRDPLFWMNWPVNDIDKGRTRRIFMGPGEVYAQGVFDVSGVLTNPMQQPEASKVGVFATLDYAWNARDFECISSWQECFGYIDVDAASSLNEIAKHVAYQDIRGVKGEALESVEIAKLSKKLDEAENKVSVLNDLKIQYTKILDAIDRYIREYGNKDLFEELKPYIKALSDKCIAALKYMDYYIESNESDLEAAKSYLEKAYNHQIPSLREEPFYAEVGAKVINNNIKQLQALAESK